MPSTPSACRWACAPAPDRLSPSTAAGLAGTEPARKRAARRSSTGQDHYVPSYRDARAPGRVSALSPTRSGAWLPPAVVYERDAHHQIPQWTDRSSSRERALRGGFSDDQQPVHVKLGNPHDEVSVFGRAVDRLFPAGSQQRAHRLAAAWPGHPDAQVADARDMVCALVVVVVEQVQNQLLADRRADHVDLRIGAVHAASFERGDRRQDAAPIVVAVTRPEAEQRVFGFPAPKSRAGRSFVGRRVASVNDDLPTTVGDVRAQRFGVLAVQTCGLWDQQGPVTCEPVRVQRPAAKSAVADVDNVVLVSGLGKNLGQRQVLFVPARTPADAAVQVHDGQVVSALRALVVLLVLADEPDVLTEPARYGGRVPRLVVDARPPVEGPPPAVGVGLEEHQLVVSR